MLPTVILPGYLAAADEYGELKSHLECLTQGEVTVVPLKRKDWFVTLGGRPVSPIIKALNATVMQVLERSGQSQVNLVGHSAGGWIARIYLGQEPYCGDRWNGLPFVSKLITLGTPHLSQERWTKQNLDFVNQTYPGAFHDEVDYVCIAGKSIYGTRAWSAGNWFTYQSYRLTCGEGQCWGDGVTPVQAAHLAGTKNLIFEGVRHSPQKSSQKSNAKSPVHQWYGSHNIVQHWMSHL